MNVLIGIFIILHGLVHMWYVTLSQGWVALQAEMGWTGESWLLGSVFESATSRFLATILYSLAAIIFVVSGAGLIARQELARTWMIIASGISAGTILIFWDGSLNMPVEKGLIGFLISAGLLVAAVIFNWPSF